MTKKDAILLLISHAAANCAGAGCGGAHRIPSYEETKRVCQAILKVWPEKHYGPNWFNLGLSEPERKPNERNHI